MEREHIRVLAALDGSRRANSVVGYLRGMLRPGQVDEVVLYHVLDTVPESYWDLDRNPAYHARVAGVKAWARAQRDAMEERLNGLRRRLLRSGLEPEQVKVKISERKAGISRDILREASSKYDLVVVGRRGLGAVRGLVLGSVTNKLIGRLTNLPMWVVGKNARSGGVLVALDGSDNSWRAVEHLAADHVSRDQDILLYSVGRRDIPEELEADTSASQRIEDVLDRASGRLVEAGFNAKRIRTRLVTGVSSRAVSIVDQARKEECDTIVMGRWGVSHPAMFPLGRVTGKVLQLSRGLAVWVIN